MIIARYLTKEVLSTLLAVTVVLLLIFMSNMLVRYLSYVAAGKLATNVLLQLLGFEIPYLLALVLPLGLYLGIIVTFGRLYADSELRVMTACGISIKQLLMMMSALIIFTTSVIFILMLWINPHIAATKEQIVANSMSEDNLLATVMPGRFQTANGGKRVIYIERMARDRKQAHNVFIAEQGKSSADAQGDSWTVVSAAKGYQTKDKLTLERFMVATDGYRYEGIPGQNDYKIIQFKKYAVRIPETVIHTQHQDTQALTTQALWNSYQNPEHAAELQWRLAIPLSALLLAMLAIPLSYVRPRQGRYTQLLPAMLIYIVYINLLFIARSWIEQKMLPISLGMWWVHGVLLVLVIILVMLQSNWRIRQRVRR